MTVLPSSMGAQMGMAQSQHAAQNVQDQSRTIDTLKRDLSPPKDKAKKLREACEGFESVFIQKMWEQMRATVPKGGLLQGRDEQYWQGMFDQELSKKMSSAGGIGLADMMYEQLSRNLISATRTTASGLGAAASDSAQTAATGFVASVAPLLPPAGQNSQAMAQAGDAGAANAGSGNAALYAQEAPQPQAATPSGNQASGQGNSQSTDAAHTAVAQGQAGAASQAAPDTTPAEVQQVLDQLRTQATTTMTGAQAIAAVQSMTPSQALALSQGMSWSQVQAMQPSTANLGAAAGLSPEMLGQAANAAQGHSMPSGLENARAATQAANTRMPAGGVLPPMTPMQREARMNYSAAKVQGQGMSSQPHTPLPAATPTGVTGKVDKSADAAHTQAATAQGTAADILARTTAARQSSTMPTNPNLFSNVQGSPGVSPTKFVQNSPLINNGAAQNVPVQTQGQTQAMAQSMAAPATNASPAPVSMTGEQIAALSGQAPQAMPPHMTQNVPQAGAAATVVSNGQQTSPAVPPTAQEPHIVNTTFTTNVPPARRNARQGQRVPKGQPAIRTLNTGGQG